MLKQLWGMAKYVLRIRAPLKVSHYMTYRCVLDCDMCGRKEIAYKKEDELSTDKCIELMSEFRKHGTIVWGFSGGECLMRDDIATLTGKAKEMGMTLTMSTNGVLIPHKLDAISYIDVLNISLDGNERTHDNLRGKGNYEKVIDSLEILKRYPVKGQKRVIQYILNNETIDPEVLNQSVNVARNYGLEIGFNLSTVHRTDTEKRAQKYLPTPKQFDSFIEWLEEKKKTEYKKYLLDDVHFFKYIGSYPTNPQQIPCHAGFFECAIDPFGKILPCSNWFDFEENYGVRNFVYGSGYEGFLKLKTLSICKSCPLKFCVTAKTNYIIGSPSILVRKYIFGKELK